MRSLRLVRFGLGGNMRKQEFGDGVFASRHERTTERRRATGVSVLLFGYYTLYLTVIFLLFAISTMGWRGNTSGRSGTVSNI